MRPNIFLIDPRLSDEDALTAYWHYLLSVVPGVGQKFVDATCASSGLTPSTFLGAIDHPTGDTENRPDLLIQCKDWSVLFEHKLDSPVGPRQLERYLELAQRHGWKLAVLAGKRIPIDGEVRNSPHFVAPEDPARGGHFLWHDLHPVLAGMNDHLVAEFIELLEHWGLGKFSWAGRGNPFIHDDAAKALLGLYDSLRASFAGPGVHCRKRRNSLIYEVRTPFQPIHLVNFGPLRSVAQENAGLRGPVMGGWIWVRRPRVSQERVLSAAADTSLQLEGMPIVVENHLDSVGLPYDLAVHCERSYYVPLQYILRDSIQDSRQALVQFARAVVDHLRNEVRNTWPSKAVRPARLNQKSG